MNNNNCDLLINIDKIHTTQMGEQRIRKNLGLDVADVVAWCKKVICQKDCTIMRKGKNWYAKRNDCTITVNAHSYTIITAHRITK